MFDNFKNLQQVGRAGGVLKNVNGIRFVHSAPDYCLKTKSKNAVLSRST